MKMYVSIMSLYINLFLIVLIIYFSDPEEVQSIILSASQNQFSFLNKTISSVNP